jgi:hypothetical protein
MRPFKLKSSKLFYYLNNANVGVSRSDQHCRLNYPHQDLPWST